MTWKKVVGVALVFSLCAAMSSEAHAGWLHRMFHSSGSSGSHSSGSSGSWGSHSSGSSGSWGSHSSGGWRRHHHSSGSYGSSSYGSSSYGSSSYGSSSYGSSSYGSSSYGSASYGSYGSSSYGSSSYGSSGGVYYSAPVIEHAAPSIHYSAPAMEYSTPSYSTPSYSAPIEQHQYSAPVQPQVQPQQQTEPLPKGEGVSTDAALSVNVPEGAKVYVNGLATSSTGGARRYVSRGLRDGFSYTYEVRAEMERDGKKFEQTKVVSLKAGGAANLAFDFESARPQTVLTLEVPADAKVKLAGAETKLTGSTRVFKTTALEAGAEWKDYKIVVTLDRNGRPVTKEKTVTLKAGDELNLRIDFTDSQVADAR